MAPQELAARRYADAQRSCALLNCRMVALHYINRGTEVTMARYKEFAEVLLEQKPDIAFTHWPLDTHPDHRAASMLSYDAWLRGGKKSIVITADPHKMASPGYCSIGGCTQLLSHQAHRPGIDSSTFQAEFIVNPTDLNNAVDLFADDGD
jgi:LmbE family N-acetylglucosaminyl deacetylase